MTHERLAARSTAAWVAIRVAWVVGPGALLAVVAQEALSTSCAPDAGGCDLESIGFVVAILVFALLTTALVAVAFVRDAWRGRGWGFAARHLAGVAVGALACLAIFVYGPGDEPTAALDLVPYLVAFTGPYAAGLAAARGRDRGR